MSVPFCSLDASNIEPMGADPIGLISFDNIVGTFGSVLTPPDWVAVYEDNAILLVLDGPILFSVRYAANGATGGAVPFDPGSPYEPDSTVVVLGNAGDLVRTGHTFNGWNTASDGNCQKLNENE